MDETDSLLSTNDVEMLSSYPSSLGASISDLVEVGCDRSPPTWTYDEAVEKVGFGVYQFILWFFLSLVNVSLALNNLAVIFEGGDSGHLCHTPANVTTLDNLTIIHHPGRCNYNVTILYSNGTPADFQHSVKCSKWNFDHSVFNSTLNSEWQLACDKEYLVSLTMTVYWIGHFVGGTIQGNLADKFGRKTILLTSSLLTLLVSIGAAFSPSLSIFSALRFFAGIGACGCRISAYILAMEYSRSKDRGILGLYNECVVGIAYMLSSVIFYLDPNWRNFQIYISIPSMLFLTYVFFIPESPRWQLAVGRTDAALCYFKKSAKINRKILPNELAIILCGNSEHEQRNVFVWDLLRTRNIWMLTLICCLFWFAVAVSYYGISYNVGNLYGSIYWNNTLLGGTDFLANVLAMLILRFSRKRAIASSFATAAIAMFISAIFQGAQMLAVIMSMIGMFAMTTCFALANIIIVELYPTQVRTLALGLCVGVGRLGASVSPFIQLSFQWWDRMPSILFTVCAVTGTAIGLLIPETKDRPLPESIEDADRMNSVDCRFMKCQQRDLDIQTFDRPR